MSAAEWQPFFPGGDEFENKSFASSESNSYEIVVIVNKQDG